MVIWWLCLFCRIATGQRGAKDIYASGSGSSEGCSAFGYGFAGCHDVVNEEDCFCVEGLFARHGEGAYDVGGALLFV